jgi:hypothetical protein
VYFGDDESIADARVRVAGGDGHVLPADVFITEMQRKGALYVLVLQYHHALMTQIMQTTVCNGMHSAEERCCRWLLTTRGRIKRDAVPVTHDFLAQMLGVRRPTVTLIARRLQRLGLIEHRRGSFTIIDRAGLEQVACECHRALDAHVKDAAVWLRPLGDRRLAG